MANNKYIPGFVLALILCLISVVFATRMDTLTFTSFDTLTCGAGTAGIVKPTANGQVIQYCDNAGTPALFHMATGNSTGDALGGDTATGFFLTGQIEPARGGTGADNTATTGRYLRGNGTNFVTSSVAAGGAGSCTNQFVRATVDNAAPTCATVDDASVADDLTISGGTVNNTPIGATTPSTGNFTTLKLNLDCTGSGNNGKLTTDAAGNVSCADDVSAGFSCTLNVFTTSGEWTKPAGLAYVVAHIVGPGGGGGGAATTGSGQATFGRNGAGGGYARKHIPAAALGATETVTVGTGGAGATAGANSGSAGSGPSSFGSHVSASEGGGGPAGGAFAVGADSLIGASGTSGGAGSNGDVNVTGQAGYTAGRGGASVGPFGGAAVLGPANADGIPGQLYGGGGSAGLNRASQGTARAGGAGAAGIVVVEECVQ